MKGLCPRNSLPRGRNGNSFAPAPRRTQFLRSAALAPVSVNTSLVTAATASDAKAQQRPTFFPAYFACASVNWDPADDESCWINPWQENDSALR